MPSATRRQTTSTQRAARLTLRATLRQDRAIRQAAALAGKSVTDFVLDSAVAAAEAALADRRRFVLSPAAWDAFIAALEAPAKDRPRLQRLMQEPGVLEKP